MRYNRTPKYVRVASAIEHDVFQKQCKPGDPLPTEQQLCKHFDCSRGTVRQAIDILEKNNLVERRQGSGMFVGKRNLPAMGHFIATIVSNVTTSENSRMVQAIGMATIANGYYPLLGVTSDQPEIERQFIDAIYQLDVVGVLKFPTNIEREDETRARLRKQGIPYVILNDFWADCRQDVQVAYDERTSVAMCIEHLTELGHERIVMLDSVVDPRDRAIDEFFKCLARSDLLRDEQHLLLYDLVNPAPPVEELFGRGKLNPTAFVTVFDVIASQLVGKLTRMGIDIPEHVSVCNVNDIPLEMPSGMDLTTAVPPRNKIVDQALRALLSAQGQGHVQHYIFKPELHVGQTTGPCPVSQEKASAPETEATKTEVLDHV